MRLPAALLVIAATVLSGLPRGRPRTVDRCVFPRARTLAVNGQVRVSLRYDTITACARRSGRRTELGMQTGRRCFPDACTAEHVRLGGRRVAYATTAGGREGISYDIEVLHAVTGRKLVYVADVGPATDLEFREDGLIARIAFDVCDPAFPRPAKVRLLAPGSWLLAPGSVERRVASGAGIDPTSLALTRDGVYWSRDGRGETAR